MTLADIITTLETLPDQAVIYAQKIAGEWKEESFAIVMDEPEDGNLKQTVSGQEVEYLLEVFLVRQVVSWLKKLSNRQELTVSERLKVIIFYAEHDTYPRDDQGNYYIGD